MVCTEFCQHALLSVYISVNLILFFVQVPWLVYFISQFLEARSRSASLMRIGDINLLQKHKNTKKLYKYFIVATTFEFLTILLIIFNYIFDVKLLRYTLNCEEYYFTLYLYVKYFIGFLSVLCLMGGIEVLNFTTKFALKIFILNRNSEKQKTKKLIIKIVLLVSLALSGVGMIVAFILVEILLVKESIQYYQNSRELYKKLRIIYEDVKYEFGETHINTRSARMNSLHYKRFTLWFSTVVFVVMIASVFFVFRIPLNLFAEQCVLETITRYKYNSTILDSIHYNDILEGASILGKVIHVLFMILFIPLYIFYSLYYLCNKLLFVNVYPHRYQVGSAVEADDINALLMHN